jgi:hypothetical protein
MKLIREHINEKFVEDSDPIEDIGIGIKNFWRKELEKEGKISSIQSSINYYGTSNYADAAFAVYRVLKYVALKNVSTQQEIQEIFEDCIEHMSSSYKDRVIKDIKKVKEALEKFFYINVDITPFKKQSLQEKFDEDSDPISDMGIGISHIFPQICKSILEHDKNKLIFTIQYIQSNAPKFNFDKFIVIYLNHPRMNDFKELCTLDAIKNYVKTIIINSIEYKKNIFSDIKLEGRFKYYQPDIDEDFFVIRSCPTLYCEINPEIKPKYKFISVQRYHYNYNIINIRTE